MKIEFNKILAIGAHFDDIEIGCGGTLVKFSESGSEVMMVVIGDGSYSHYKGIILRTNTEAVREGIGAVKELGLMENSLKNLSYPERRIPLNDKLIDDLEKIIDDFKPDLIITHWMHDSHQDHVTTSNAVVSAARYYPSIWMWEPIFPSGRVITIPYIPQIYVDISGYVEIKSRALRAHKTQVQKYYDRGVKWIEGIETRSKFRGFECTVDSAETFYVYRQKVK